MKRIFTTSVATLCMVSVAGAGTFGGSGGQGTSIIDSVNPAGADYPSLAAAAADFNSFPGGCTGDWTLLIRSNLTEPNDVAFGNATNGHTVTIRPAPSTSPVITFTTTTAAVGYSACIAIGTTSTQLGGDLLTTTSNVILDGSNVPGGNSRNLTLKNVPSTGAPSNKWNMLRVVGPCDNVQFRNLVLDNQSTTNTGEAFMIDFNARRTAGGANYVPTNGRVENCDIRATSATKSYGISVRAQGTAPTGAAPGGFTIVGNTIRTCAKGIFLSYCGQADVRNNTISVNGITDRPEVILHGGATGVGGWTTTIANNHIDSVTGFKGSAAGILSCISVGTGVTSPTTARYDIFNNMIGGLDVSGTTVTSGAFNAPAAGIYRAVIIEGNDSLLTVNFHHNSINMPNFANLSPPNIPTRYCALSVNGTGWLGTLNMTNNIIRYEQNNGALFYRNSGGTGTVNSDSNVFHLGSSGAKMASYMVGNTGFSHNTLAQWKASGFDALSVEADPTVAHAPATGKWVSAGDLHFDASPGNLFAGTPGSGITTDIDGQTRSTTNPYAGADERAEPLQRQTAATDWTTFE